METTDNSGTLKFSNPAVKEETKHTPGPWTYRRTHEMSSDNWYVIVDSNGKGPIVDVGGKDLSGQIAEAKYLVTDPKEIEANARLIASAPDLLKERDELRAWKKLHEDSSYGGILNQLQKAEKENQELKAERDYWFDQAKNHPVNGELLEALEEAVFMIQGYQVQHGEGPSNKKKLESLKSILNKS